MKLSILKSKKKKKKKKQKTQQNEQTNKKTHFKQIILDLIFFLNLFILFIYFWLHWVFAAARGLSLVAASGGYSLLQCMGFSFQWLLLLRSTGSRRVDFSSCGTRAQ